MPFCVEYNILFWNYYIISIQIIIKIIAKLIIKILINMLSIFFYKMSEFIASKG